MVRSENSLSGGKTASEENGVSGSVGKKIRHSSHMGPCPGFTAKSPFTEKVDRDKCYSKGSGT